MPTTRGPRKPSAWPPISRPSLRRAIWSRGVPHPRINSTIMSKLPWHGPLFQVKGHLADRYALALKQVAKLDCPLAEFSIDRLGWSPQLAAQLGEDYLGAAALRYAIILSPDQAAAPPIHRRFSYEAALAEE